MFEKLKFKRPMGLGAKSAITFLIVVLGAFAYKSFAETPLEPESAVIETPADQAIDPVVEDDIHDEGKISSLKTLLTNASESLGNIKRSIADYLDRNEAVEDTEPVETVPVGNLQPTEPES